MTKGFFLFGNAFRNHKISPARLYAFGTTVLQALILANTDHQFDTLIPALTAALLALRQEMSGVDTGLSDQKTETQTVDEFILSFSQYMSDNEPFIARQLGGRNSAGYKMIFPFRLSEYAQATKTTMPTLTDRLEMAVKKYGSKLDPAIAEKLQSFKPDFDKQYGMQQQQIQAVKQDRTQKKTAFVNLQLSLTSAVFAVGYQYPGDAAKCSAFFPFHMLFPQTKPRKYVIAGTVEKETTAELMNYLLNPTAIVTLRNKSNNAMYAVWLAGSVTDAMPADAKVVNPGETFTLKAPKLGDIKTEPFFMVQNLSDVNPCSYEITFTGLRKKDALQKSQVKSGELQIIEEEVDAAI